MNLNTYTLPHCIIRLLSIISGLTAWSWTAWSADGDTPRVHNNSNITNNFYIGHPHCVGYLDTFYTILLYYFLLFLNIKTNTHENFATH